MPWFLVDDDYPIHPGVLATSLAARGLWVTAGAWSSRRLTDVVPDHVLASLGSTPELAAELVAARVWKRVRGGYRFLQSGICKIPDRETVDNARKAKTARQGRWRDGQRRRPVDASTPPSTDASLLVTSTDTEGIPLTPAAAAAGEHRGQHKHCRACGTNPRGQPPPTPIPPRYQPPNGTPARGETVTAIAAEARQAITQTTQEGTTP